MHLYAIAVGSNRTRGIGRRPGQIVAAAILMLGELGRVTARSPVIETAALGPAGRRFANAAVLVETALDPPALLAALKRIERAGGRRRGRRWGARTIDLDILLWSGGRWESRRPALIVPHPALAVRRFVLVPLLAIAADWRLPGGTLRVRHLALRLTRRVPFHRAGAGRVRSSVGRAHDF